MYLKIIVIISVFKCRNPDGIKFITRLRLGLSHLREHKFKHSFQDSLNPLCKCGIEVESTSHFLPHCLVYSNDRYSSVTVWKSIS